MLSPTTLLLSAMLAAPPAPEAAPTGDLARLQGTWTTLAGPRHAFPVTLTIHERRVSVIVAPAVGPKIEAEGELILDEAASPKALDWVRFRLSDGDELPEVAAIYELDGDTLRVANGGAHNPRPIEFAPGDGVLADVVTFRRVPAVAAADPAR